MDDRQQVMAKAHIAFDKGSGTGTSCLTPVFMNKES
jgi:hypothetical protein